MIRPFCLLLLIACPLAADQPRYAARLDDGSFVEADDLDGWLANPPRPMLEGRPILEGENPIRWLINRRRLPGQPPGSYVEMITGDRVPGEVIGFDDGTASPFETLPPHLIVRTPLVMRGPTGVLPGKLRIISRFVRRIVRLHDVTTPESMLIDRAGREIAFRSIRFTSTGVTLLTRDGLQQHTFDRIARLELPAQDAWASLYDELAILGANEGARVIGVETSSSAKFTTSSTRLRVHKTGNSRFLSSVSFGLQPAWSLDCIWLPEQDIWLWKSFLPTDVPLSRIAPSRVTARSMIAGKGFKLQADRDLFGNGLRVRRDAGGLGFRCSCSEPDALRFARRGV